jgi:hypothetical protein
MDCVLHAFEHLMEKMEHAKEFVEDNPEPKLFAININNGWKKLRKYYLYLNQSPVYYAATALNPARRWAYFEDKWQHEEGPGWIRDAKTMVQRLWDEEYRDLILDDNVSISSLPSLSSDEDGDGDGDDNGRLVKRARYSDWKKPRRTLHHNRRRRIGDEYAHWQANEQPTDEGIKDSIDYWISKRVEYPRLSRMALDVLTVPAMSAECERLFSSVGRMVTPLRNRLDVNTMGIVQSLRSWQRARLIGTVGALDEFI